MTILIPLWVGVGRGIVGVLSIGALYTAILAAPLLFLIQLTIALIVRKTPTANTDRALSARLARTLTTYYLAAFIFGFTFVDFAINGSVLLTLTGDDYDFSVGSGSFYMSDISGWISVLSAAVALIALCFSFVWAICDLQAAKRQNG